MSANWEAIDSRKKNNGRIDLTFKIDGDLLSDVHVFPDTKPATAFMYLHTG